MTFYSFIVVYVSAFSSLWTFFVLIKSSAKWLSTSTFTRNISSFMVAMDPSTVKSTTRDFMVVHYSSNLIRRSQINLLYLACWPLATVIVAWVSWELNPFFLTALQRSNRGLNMYGKKPGVLARISKLDPILRLFPATISIIVAIFFRRDSFETRKRYRLL